MTGATNRTRLRSALLASAAASALLLATGCGAETAEEPPAPPTGTSQPTTATSPTSPTTDAAPIATADIDQLVAAGRLALTRQAGTIVGAIEEDDGGSTWEVDLSTKAGDKYEVKTSADGTEVRRGPKADSGSARSRAERRHRVTAATADFEKVAGILAERFPGGRITELGLDDHAGEVAWEADVRDAGGVKHEVVLDAGTGEIIDVRPRA